MRVTRITITIPDRRPPSHQTFYSGAHWGNRAKIAKDWHQIVQLAMRERGIGRMPLRECEITITAKMKGKMIDPCNLAAKVQIDGMKRWQTMKSKNGFNKKALRPGEIIFNDKRDMARIENERFMFEDDCYPYVKWVKTMVVPYDRDEIEIEVAGIPVEGGR